MLRYAIGFASYALMIFVACLFGVTIVRSFPGNPAACIAVTPLLAFKFLFWARGINETCFNRYS
jgi:hypothetical protein